MENDLESFARDVPSPQLLINNTTAEGLTYFGKGLYFGRAQNRPLPCANPSHGTRAQLHTVANKQIDSYKHELTTPQDRVLVHD